MHPFSISADYDSAAKSLAAADAGADAMAREIVANGVPADWSPRVCSEAYEILRRRQVALPRYECHTELHDIIFTARDRLSNA